MTNWLFIKFTSRIYIRLYPELDRFPAGFERSRALRRATASWIYWLALIVALCCAEAAFVGARKNLLPLAYGSIGGSVFVWNLVVAIILGGMVGIGLSFAFRNWIRTRLRQQLISKGVPICIRCGYDLRAQVIPRCPECGTPFDTLLMETQQS